ncbi:hypothetical protein QR680_009696 [Steinernema hermaphroditum]|uniref:Uncharacterized protein n=1 Tax=Steinernema hermaphroditum TaxID=289476 RepID=A0AA39INA5_9BILA|nr:hypothetical protein QR680_009696 [Steinernema hermaphroditum]
MSAIVRRRPGWLIAALIRKRQLPEACSSRGRVALFSCVAFRGVIIGASAGLGHSDEQLLPTEPITQTNNPGVVSRAPFSAECSAMDNDGLGRTILSAIRNAPVEFAERILRPQKSLDDATPEPKPELKRRDSDPGPPTTPKVIKDYGG